MLVLLNCPYVIVDGRPSQNVIRIVSSVVRKLKCHLVSLIDQFVRRSGRERTTSLRLVLTVRFLE